MGLGNPTKAYTETRHNMGFMAVSLYAKKLGASFSLLRGIEAHVAKACGGELLLALPQTYMNSSGEAAASLVREYGLSVANLLVVLDDVALPFGAMRLREQGSSGGHNGLKSIIDHLEGSEAFARLRLGIERVPREALSDFVLSPFDEKEKETLNEVLERACAAMDLWVREGSASAMRFANVNNKEEEK